MLSSQESEPVPQSANSTCSEGLGSRHGLLSENEALESVHWHFKAAFVDCLVACYQAVIHVCL